MRYTIALSLASLIAAAPALRAEVPVVVTDIAPVQALVPWVLGRPGKDDDILIHRAIDDAIDALPLAVAGNHMDAMTKLHTPK